MFRFKTIDKKDALGVCLQVRSSTAYNAPTFRIRNKKYCRWVTYYESEDYPIVWEMYVNLCYHIFKHNSERITET
jgi:hypothetical protein